MPPLTPVVDSLDKVPEAARQFYEQKDGKFHVILDATPPGYVPQAEHATQVNKVVEFRDKNITLLKEVDELRPLKTKFEGIDPDKARTAITELAEIKAKGITKPDDIGTQIKAAVEAAVTPLKEEISSSKAEIAAERKRADDATLRSTVGERFGKIGGIPSALDFIVQKAATVFKVSNGAVIAEANKFSSEKPGEPLTMDEWLQTMTKEADFAFKPSSGAGDHTRPGGGGGNDGLKPGQTVLRNPTPQQLGEHAKDIRLGKVVVRHDPPQHT